MNNPTCHSQKSEPESTKLNYTDKELRHVLFPDRIIGFSRSPSSGRYFSAEPRYLNPLSGQHVISEAEVVDTLYQLLKTEDRQSLKIANSFLDSVLSEDPRHPDFRLYKAVTLQRLGKKPDALQIIDELISSGLRLCLTFGLKADLCQEMKKYDAAFKAVHQSQVIYRKHPLTLNALAKIHYSLKDYNRVLHTTDVILTFEPLCIEARKTRARAHLDLNQPDDALRTAQRALELNPSSVTAIRLKSRALVQMNLLPEALQTLEDVPVPQSKNLSLLKDKARLQCKLGMYEDGIRTINISLARSIDDSEAYAIKAELLEGFGWPNEAMRVVEHSLWLFPGNKEALLLREKLNKKSVV